MEETALYSAAVGCNHDRELASRRLCVASESVSESPGDLGAMLFLLWPKVFLNMGSRARLLYCLQSRDLAWKNADSASSPKVRSFSLPWDCWSLGVHFPRLPGVLMKDPSTVLLWNSSLLEGSRMAK